MKMKKQACVLALALGLGVAAGALPQGDTPYPTAQVGYLLELPVSLWIDPRLPEIDSAGCYPWTLDVNCTGVPSRFPGRGIDRVLSLFRG